VTTDLGVIERTAHGVSGWLERRSTAGLFLVVVLPVFVLFFLTSQRSLPYGIDSFSNAVPAWSIATHGTVHLDDYAGLTGAEHFGSVAWFVEVDGTAVSQYPPGAALWGVPFYLVGPDELEWVTGTAYNNPELGDVVIPVPPLGPAAAAAAASAALAIGWLALTFRSLVSTRWAVTGAGLAALGTSAWNVASSQLWQHGPAMMWLALGGLLASRSRLWSSGVGHGMAVLTRPLTGTVAAGIGVWMALRERSWGPVVKIGAGATAGLLAVVAYNAMVFGEPSISGGYGAHFVDEAITSSPLWWLGNVLGGLVDPVRGLLVWSPFLLVLIPGLRAAWRAAPAWVRGGAVGAVLYLLIQYKSNRFSGGGGFYGYRYPLEALVAAAPLLVLAFREWVADRPMALKAFGLLAIASVTLQTVVVVRF
jgi:alpha-1,2-mannosyltransferase